MCSLRPAVDESDEEDYDLGEPGVPATVEECFLAPHFRNACIQFGMPEPALESILWLVKLGEEGGGSQWSRDVHKLPVNRRVNLYRMIHSLEDQHDPQEPFDKWFAVHGQSLLP